MSVVMSALMVVVAILFLQNEKVVDAADSVVLLEKRHPGYWEFSKIKGSYVDLDTDGEFDIALFPYSKFLLADFTPGDYRTLRNASNRKKVKKQLIYFPDGSSIDILSSEYGVLDIKSFTLNDSTNIEDHGGYLSLSGISESNNRGINGISYSSEQPINEITDIYQYLYELKKNQYSFAISAMDDASTSWNEILQESLEKFNLTEEFHYRDSYIAIVECGNKIYEKAVYTSMEFSGNIDNQALYIKSSGHDSTSDCVIEINHCDYSQKGRGLNIVVLKDGKVIDSVNFDTWNWAMTCSR